MPCVIRRRVAAEFAPYSRPMGARDVDRRAHAIEAEVGHPGDLLDGLRRRAEQGRLREFRQIQADWLALMWCLDAYRRAGVPPRDMGKPGQDPADRLEGVIRSKGNWFATLLAILLTNRTSQRIGARTRIRGFSQTHQIDLAWPEREIDPRVCVETKVTGGPPYANRPARAATADWTNRRKELKFAATDLKLWRRQQDTSIRHWGQWRSEAPPRTYFLWAARLKTEGHRGRGNDSLAHMILEVRALVDTYMEGAGIFAWRENAAHTGYEVVPLPAEARVVELDDVLYRIATSVADLMAGGRVPPPELPPREEVDVATLEGDENAD